MKLIHLGQVRITGNRYVDASEVRYIFRSDIDDSVLRIPLEARRRQLEEIPWIASATVRRALPNTLQVDITERTPIAFLREGTGLSLIDIHGVILDRPLRDDFHFPVVTGIRTDMSPDDREERMHLFAGFMQGVSAAHAGAADSVNEVNLSDDHDLQATFTGLQSDFYGVSADAAPGTMAAASAPLLVHFGDGDFESKYQTLLEKIAEVRAKVGPIESIDLRFSGELVANPDTVAIVTPPATKKDAIAVGHSH